MNKSRSILCLFLVLATFSQAQINMPEREKEMEEVHIIPKSKKQRGKEIMKKVIGQREFYANQLKNYSVETYCFTTLDKEKEDTIKDNMNETERINQLEWMASSYYKDKGNYKDVFHGYLDYSNQNNLIKYEGGSNEPNLLGNESLKSYVSLSTNPFVFVKSYKDADINLYTSQINAPQLSTNTIISPLADNAFLYYTYYLESTNLLRQDSIVYEIRVEQIFKEEALFSGTLTIRDKSWEIIDYNLFLNKGGMELFQTMQLEGSYRKIQNILVPTQRKFNYITREGKLLIFGTSEVYYSNYTIPTSEKPTDFWLESIQYDTDSYSHKQTYWDSIRPQKLSQIDLSFISKQDSIFSVVNSDTAIHRRDSIYNTVSFWDFYYRGMGFRNTFKKREFYINPFLDQFVPFGVGGFRYRLGVSYEKEFNNGKEFYIKPLIDYGFLNKDLKGELTVKYFYNPLKNSSVKIDIGDVYDFVNSYQSIIGTWGPSNRVRNQKIEIAHRQEISNGLYFNKEFLFSYRSAITNVKYPEWVSLFGTFANPVPFESYKVSRLTLELEYYHQQKYLIKDNKKIVLGSKWPVIGTKLQIGIPKLFHGQSNYGYLELRISDDRKIRTFGLINYRLIFGQFIYKNDLRLIELKYFRSSDKFLFSMPNNSLQLLDTNMNTSNAFVQCNAIHHFNGFFLNKLWMINKLKLEESIGGSLLYLPNSGFLQIESYVGVERKVRIRKEIFKFGIYFVNANSTHTHHTTGIKFGINGYDRFSNKWLY